MHQEIEKPIAGFGYNIQRDNIMSPVLKLKNDNQKKELIFELKYLLSLTTRQRFEMMLKKSQEIKNLLGKRGLRKAFQIIKRT
jgi:hypothetical protein